MSLSIYHEAIEISCLVCLVLLHSAQNKYLKLVSHLLEIVTLSQIVNDFPWKMYSIKFDGLCSAIFKEWPVTDCYFEV